MEGDLDLTIMVRRIKKEVLPNLDLRVNFEPDVEVADPQWSL